MDEANGLLPNDRLTILCEVSWNMIIFIRTFLFCYEIYYFFNFIGNKYFNFISKIFENTFIKRFL